MIYLVHHADAVDADVDPQRPLSPRGLAHAAQQAADAAARGVRPVAIWHSGKLRARQTAEAFRAACNPAALFSAIRGLQPTDPPEWIRDLLTAEQREVMLVGHYPSLPRILRALVGDPVESGVEEFPIHGVVALEAEEGRWVERWRVGRA